MRSARALYGLERYPECAAVLEDLDARFPGKRSTRSFLDRAVARCIEQNIGHYDFTELYKQVEERRPPLLDCATFIGPVAVKDAGAKGRGLFTTRAVNAGDLLFCEKAFAHVYCDLDDPKAKVPELIVNIDHGTMYMGGQADLMAIMAQKLRRNPSLISAIRDLDTGAYKPAEPTEVDGKPIIDTYVLTRLDTFSII
jgi:hypothetical protein